MPVIAGRAKLQFLQCLNRAVPPSPIMQFKNDQPSPVTPRFNFMTKPMTSATA